MKNKRGSYTFCNKSIKYKKKECVYQIIHYMRKKKFEKNRHYFNHITHSSDGAIFFSGY